MAHKDENGKIFKVNPVCSHLGCELAWNNLEKLGTVPAMVQDLLMMANQYMHQVLKIYNNYLQTSVYKMQIS